jgi:hypothetical protein
MAGLHGIYANSRAIPRVSSNYLLIAFHTSFSMFFTQMSLQSERLQNMDQT